MKKQTRWAALFEALGHPVMHLLDARVIWTAVPAILVLWFIDAAILKAVVTLFLFVLIAVAVAHWVRKTLFGYADLSDFSRAALKGNVAAAIVTVGLLFFMLGIVFLVLQAGMR